VKDPFLQIRSHIALIIWNWCLQKNLFLIAAGRRKLLQTRNPEYEGLLWLDVEYLCPLADSDADRPVGDRLVCISPDKHLPHFYSWRLDSKAEKYGYIAPEKRILPPLHCLIICSNKAAKDHSSYDHTALDHKTIVSSNSQNLMLESYLLSSWKAKNQVKLKLTVYQMNGLVPAKG